MQRNVQVHNSTCLIAKDQKEDKSIKKSKLTKIQKAILGIVTLVVIVMITSSFYEKKLPIIKKDADLNEKVTVDGDIIFEIVEKTPPNLLKEFPEGVSDHIIINTIHAMSHQKVKAKEKWSMIPLTQDRVARLIYVIENGEYDKSEMFLDILYRWRDNDFRQAVNDHNKMWKLQLGTVGRATGLLSAEEEREFIEKHFDLK